SDKRPCERLHCSVRGQPVPVDRRLQAYELISHVVQHPLRITLEGVAVAGPAGAHRPDDVTRTAPERLQLRRQADLPAIGRDLQSLARGPLTTTECALRRGAVPLPLPPPLGLRLGPPVAEPNHPPPPPAPAPP